MEMRRWLSIKLQEKVDSEHTQGNVGSQVISPTFTPHLPTCSHCSKEIELIEGDVIFGEKWYHHLCWQSIKLEEGSWIGKQNRPNSCRKWFKDFRTKRKTLEESCQTGSKQRNGCNFFHDFSSMVYHDVLYCRSVDSWNTTSYELRSGPISYDVVLSPSFTYQYLALVRISEYVSCCRQKNWETAGIAYQKQKIHQPSTCYHLNSSKKWRVSHKKNDKQLPVTNLQEHRDPSHMS